MPSSGVRVDDSAENYILISSVSLIVIFIMYHLVLKPESFENLIFSNFQLGIP
jgi:hypothetical protein